MHRIPVIATVLVLAACVTLSSAQEPLPTCADAAYADIRNTESRGMKFLNAEEVIIRGVEGRAEVALFRNSRGAAELHVLAPSHFAEFLGNHGYNDTGIRCTDDVVMWLVVKPLEKEGEEI